MQLKTIILVTVLALGLLWSCEVSESELNSRIEDEILTLIAADDKIGRAHV